MTDWQAVSSHLAVEVMGWHKSGETYVDKYNCCEGFVVDWQPHRKWRHTGMVIDEMREHNFHLALFYTGIRNKFVAYFYECSWNINGLEDLGLGQPKNRVSQETELKAIALAAALATGYVERPSDENIQQTLNQVAYPFSKQERNVLSCAAANVRQKERCAPNTYSKEALLSAWNNLRYEETLKKQDKVILELRQIDKERNDAGLLLSSIRYRLLDKTDNPCLSLTLAEKMILASIEKWVKDNEFL